MKKKGEKAISSKSHINRDNEPKNIEQAILKNLVELQKIHVDLAEKFDKLAREISEMLALFELAARSFAKNAPTSEIEKDKEFLEKIDKLLEQNKVLAKGLTLMEERLREKMYGFSPPAPAPQTQETSQQQERKSQLAEQQERFRPSISSSGRPLPHF